MLSFKQVGGAAMMSRSIAGVSKGKVVMCIPGSPDAASLALKELVLSDLGHMVWEAKR
jgi:molybdenum cofactor biosynthesis protein B